MRYLLSILLIFVYLSGNAQENDSLYNNLLEQKAWEKALDYCKEQITNAKHDSLQWSWQVEEIALYRKSKQYEKAEQNYLELLKSATGDKRITLLTEAIPLYEALGQMDLMAELDAERLELIASKLGKENPQYIRALMQHGNLQMSRQRYRKAEFLFETALSLWEAIGEQKSLNYAETQNYLAAAYSALHKDEKAINLYLSILDILEKEMGINSQPYRVVSGNLSQSYLKLGQLDQAINLAKNALAICRQTDPSGKSCDNDLLQIAFTYMNMEEYDLALDALKEVVEIRQEAYGPQHPQVSIAHINLADGYRRKGQYKEGETAILNAIYANTPSLEKAPSMKEMKKLIFKEEFLNPYLIATALSMLDKVYDSQYKNTEDLEVLKKRFGTLKLFGRYIDKVANDFRADEDKLWLVSVSNKEYAKAIEVAHLLYQKTENQAYLDQSFFFFESNKAALLAATLKGDEALRFGNIPSDLLEKENSLKQELDLLRKQLQEAQIQKNKQSENEARTALNSHKNKIADFQKTLETDYPQYFDYKYEQLLPEIKIFQKEVLTEGQVLVEYYWWKERAFVLGITQNQVLLEEIEVSDKTLEEAITNFRNSLTNYEQISANPQEAKNNYLKHAHQLYQQLLEPVLTQLEGVQALTIIPDDVIGHLPFEALLTEEGKADQSFAEMPYLVKKYQLNYSYSAALLLENLKPKSNKASKDVLAFAASYQAEAGTAETRSLRHSKLRKILQDLPAVKQEVENIQKYFNGTFLYEKAANEGFFLDHAEDYAVIHLAMHGLLNKDFPLLSSLAFSENGDSLHDNFLEAHEISNLQLNANLVVLSACETGYGKFESGEGVMSLARSFMYAGVPSLVVSLWQVNDASTAIIMEEFYKELALGRSKAAALQNAKLKYIEIATEKNPIAAHPAFWAAFIQVGDPSPLQLSAASSWLSWLWVLGIPVLVAIGFWIVLRRKKAEA
jgi:CHAT domain-containing protein